MRKQQIRQSEESSVTGMRMNKSEGGIYPSASTWPKKETAANASYICLAGQAAGRGDMWLRI